MIIPIHSLIPKPVGECIGINIISHDTFRWDGFGKKCGEIYLTLQNKELTIQEIIDKTGIKQITIKKWLKKMQEIVDPSTGEVFSMVEQKDDRWKALDVDLDHISRILGTSGKGSKQKKQHQKERELYRDICLRNLENRR